jgi:hypothetical protein
VHQRARKAAAEEESRLLEEARRKALQEEIRRQRLQEEAMERERVWAWRRAAPEAPKEPGQMSLDELLVFFNFAPGSRPTFSELKGAFMQVAQSSQPRPGDANYMAKNSRYRDAVYAFKNLKAAMND